MLRKCSSYICSTYILGVFLGYSRYAILYLACISLIENLYNANQYGLNLRFVHYNVKLCSILYLFSILILSLAIFVILKNDCI